MGNKASKGNAPSNEATSSGGGSSKKKASKKKAPKEKVVEKPAAAAPVPAEAAKEPEAAAPAAPTTTKNDQTKGTGFVAPSPVIPNVPRHAWIVIHINDKKIGKIVMQLKGKGVPRAVDNFESKYKGASMDPKSLAVTETDPKFYLTMTAKGHDAKDGLYGVVEDGTDVVNAIKACGPDDVIVVKQAHIYPIKVAKSRV